MGEYFDAAAVCAAASASWLLSFLAHVLVWRLCRPKAALRLLALFFFLLPLAGYLIAAAVSAADKTGCVAAVILHSLLSAAYILTFPAIQAASPSLGLMRQVARAGRSGVGMGELTAGAETCLLRENLMAEGWLECREGKARLSSSGRFLRDFFAGYRRLLGLPSGKG